LKLSPIARPPSVELKVDAVAPPGAIKRIHRDQVPPVLVEGVGWVLLAAAGAVVEVPLVAHGTVRIRAARREAHGEGRRARVRIGVGVGRKPVLPAADELRFSVGAVPARSNATRRDAGKGEQNAHQPRWSYLPHGDVRWEAGKVQQVGNTMALPYEAVVG